MKIVLRAFNNKLSGVMEVPEDTGVRFRLALEQPVQVANFGSFFGDDGKHPLMDKPIETICEFEWTGSTFRQEGHAWDKAREYQLTSINKI